MFENLSLDSSDLETPHFAPIRLTVYPRNVIFKTFFLIHVLAKNVVTEQLEKMLRFKFEKCDRLPALKFHG